MLPFSQFGSGVLLQKISLSLKRAENLDAIELLEVPYNKNLLLCP